jgi:hypothetical protein
VAHKSDSLTTTIRRERVCVPSLPGRSVEDDAEHCIYP